MAAWRGRGGRRGSGELCSSQVHFTATTFLLNCNNVESEQRRLFVITFELLRKVNSWLMGRWFYCFRFLMSSDELLDNNYLKE